jgi:uncharacterized protein YlxW (UPF0749 family)
VTDTRLARLEEGLTEALVQNARLASAVEHLSDSVVDLKVTVNDLNNSMNRGRGALWVIVGASSIAGGVLTATISRFFGNGS